MADVNADEWSNATNTRSDSHPIWPGACAALTALIGLTLGLAAPAALGDRGEGCPSFPADVTYGAEDAPYPVAMGDLDGDGDLDLAVANHVTYDVSVLLNECPPACPADINGDNTVDVLDLFAVLAAWGQSGVPEDINNDGIVDVLDLLEVLAAWGPCPQPRAAGIADGSDMINPFEHQ